MGQHRSASASGLLGLGDFEVLAAEILAGEWQLKVQTTATVVGCVGCGTRAELPGRRTVRVRACRSAAGRWCCGGTSDLALLGEPACGVRTWTERAAPIGPRAVLTERARADACRRVGTDPHAVAAVARDLGARPRDWLAQVATVALDPWRGYASALTAPLGHARLVVDHFHAIRLATMVVDQVRPRTQQATLGHRAASPIRCTASASCCSPRPRSSPGGRARLRLAAGDPTGEVAAAWQGKELLRTVYRAVGPAAPAPPWSACYRWCDGVGVPELSRLAGTVRPGRPRSSLGMPPAAAPMGPPRPSTC